MSTASTIEQEMLALINAERTSRGLNPLKLETNLNESSEDHSTWMLNTDMFSHTGAGGSSATERMRDAGFDLSGSWRTGENIAWQSERGAPGISDDVAQLHQNLMNSPGHRANILNPEFEYIGIGIETGDMQGFDAVMVTQNFATTDGTVVVDTGAATPPAPTPPVAEVPDQPETEAPDTDTPDPAPETPDTDVTETTDPTPDTPDTDVTETEDPDAETPDTDVTETDDPETENPDTDVTETDDPAPETPDTDVTETDDPAPETPDTDVTETVDPAPETPETDDDSDTPNDGCFDVAAFLAEIEAFIEALQSHLDQFAWDDGDMDPSDSADDFDLVMDDSSDPVEEEPMSDTGCEDASDVFQFNFYTFDCMMDAA